MKQSLPISISDKAVMGGKNNVICLPKKTFGRERLLLEDIQNSKKPIIYDLLFQRILINYSATCNVDEKRTVLHKRKTASV